MVLRASNNLYLKTLMWTLIIVLVFFVISMIFNHSLVNSSGIVVDDSFKINPALLLNNNDIPSENIDSIIKQLTPLVKNSISGADRLRINQTIYRNFFILTFKWIGFSSILVAFANHTYFHNLLFKKIRLISGDKRIYGLFPFIYSSAIFAINAFLAFSFCLILVYSYDEFFDTARFIYWRMIVPIILQIIFATLLYVFIAAIFSKRTTLMIVLVIVNFLIPFICTILSFSSKDGYLYILVFSFLDSSSIFISMIKSSWQPGYETVGNASGIDISAIEAYRYMKYLLEKDEMPFKLWWISLPIIWSTILCAANVRIIFFRQEKYD